MIATSLDGSTLTPYFGTNQGDGGIDDFDFSDTVARYVVLILPPSASGDEIREIEVIR